MKKIIDKIILLIVLLGLLAVVALPIYLIIATAKLNNILPQWFIITNFVFSALICGIVILFIFLSFTKDKE